MQRRSPAWTCQGIVQFGTVLRTPNRNVDLGLDGAQQAATGSLVGQNLYYSMTCISGCGYAAMCKLYARKQDQ
jgi:hypothetical protein